MILCDWFEVRAVCLRNGLWSPQLTDNTCRLLVTGEKIFMRMASSIIVYIYPLAKYCYYYNIIDSGHEVRSSSSSYGGIIIFSVFLSLVLLLLVLTLVAIICICLCYKHKRSSKASPDAKTECRGDTQPRQAQPDPEYETVMDCTTAVVDLEMTENVAYAYAPVHTHKTNKKH